jgi:hypothetical protein
MRAMSGEIVAGEVEGAIVVVVAGKMAVVEAMAEMKRAKRRPRKSWRRNVGVKKSASANLSACTGHRWPSRPAMMGPLSLTPSVRAAIR